MSKTDSLIRDLDFSIWHHSLKDDWYMLDTDITLWTIANNKSEVLALIEEKHFIDKGYAYEIDLSSFQFKMYRNLAAEKMVFGMVKYKDCYDMCFYLVAANDPAKSFLDKHGLKDRMYLSKLQYAKFEALLRKQKFPKELEDQSTWLCKFPVRVIDF